MAEVMRKHGWWLQLLNLILIPIVLWYADQITDANANAALALQKATECET